jgi:hypothetical protein
MPLSSNKHPSRSQEIKEAEDHPIGMPGSSWTVREKHTVFVHDHTPRDSFDKMYTHAHAPSKFQLVLFNVVNTLNSPIALTVLIL